MVDAKRRNSTCDRAFENIGCVKPSAQTDFNDAGVCGRAGKGKECNGGGDFEEARLQSLGLVEHFRQQRRKRCVVDQLPCNADSFVKVHKMRAGINMGCHSVSLDGRP